MCCLTIVFDSVNAVTVRFAPRPIASIVAAAVLGLECAAVVVAALAYIAIGIVGDAAGRGFSFGLSAVAAIAAVGLGFLARGLWQARRWAVSPAITWQVLQGFVGAYVISAGAGNVAFGVVALALAVVALVALVALSRSAASGRQHLDGAREAVDDDNAA